MNGQMHRLIAEMSLAHLDGEARGILSPRWFGIEAGATLSDDFRIMWEPETAGEPRQLVHRCHVDSDDRKDHGGVTRCLDHAAGSICFIRDWMEDPTGYTEVEFLENLGMFLGILSHHIADLHTPVHVGHRLGPDQLGFRTVKAMHAGVERDMARVCKRVSVETTPVRPRQITRDTFWNFAEDTFNRWYLRLDDIYPDPDEAALEEMTSALLAASVSATRDLWSTILTDSGMTCRSWSTEAIQ